MVDKLWKLLGLSWRSSKYAKNRLFSDTNRHCVIDRHVQFAHINPYNYYSGSPPTPQEGLDVEMDYQIMLPLSRSRFRMYGSVSPPHSPVNRTFPPPSHLLQLSSVDLVQATANGLSFEMLINHHLRLRPAFAFPLILLRRAAAVCRTSSRPRHFDCNIV
ncbi:hypothetical protein J6590_017592 [Homalodisca vitripennis]|nr:hypothetical protein J6590_017592 [Homalodisca vitripennis]